MKISISMIVKNEQEMLPRCLQCLDYFADEIIVLDTGSTDNTKEICLSYDKVKFYESKWFDKNTEYKDFRFNVARNESIEKCSGDWIIWWDADDFIDQDGALKIRQLANSSNEDCLYTFTCVYGDWKFHHCRMFRNGSARFDDNHSCHEYLNTGGRNNIFCPDIFVQHLPSKAKLSGGDRNLQILKKDFYERGFKDQRTIFYLANSYRELGHYNDAIIMYDEYLKISQWREERYFACLYQGHCNFFMKDYDACARSIYKSFLEDDRFAESYCLMGDLLCEKGSLNKAIHWYNIALSMSEPEDSVLFLQRSAYNIYPRNKIREIEEKIKKENVLDNFDSMEKYILPSDNKQAQNALMALSLLAEKKDKKIFAVPNNDFQSKMIESYDNLNVASSGGVEMSLPKLLNGKSEIEWYCRSIGLVVKHPIDEVNYNVA